MMGLDNFASLSFLLSLYNPYDANPTTSGERSTAALNYRRRRCLNWFSYRNQHTIVRKSEIKKYKNHLVHCENRLMTLLKRYVLRLFISLKYITANVVDRNHGRIVATASTVEHSLKNSLECGRACNAKAAAIVGEVLAMRLRVEGLEHGQGRGIHVNVKKEIEKKGFKNHTKVWAIVNSLKNNGVKLILEDEVNVGNDSGFRREQRDEFVNPRD